MRKVITMLSLVAVLQACSNNGGESGVVNDGIRASDSNGALPDGHNIPANSPAIDSAHGDHRVDTENRDSSVIHH